MKKYVEPSVEILEINIEDIITTSGGGNFDNETPEV